LDFKTTLLCYFNALYQIDQATIDFFNERDLSLFQNPVGFRQAPGKTGQKPGFSTKSKETVPKTEVLEQPHFKMR
jgi:hypothetical protein